MKHVISVFAASLVALGTFAAACSSHRGAGSTGQPISDEAGNDSSTPSADAGDGDANDDAATPAPQAFVRIAHVSPDLPPIDVCIAPHGTTNFQGPLVGQLATSLAGGDGGSQDAAPPGLTFSQVSAYLPVPPGQYDVRLVAAGSPDCSASLAAGLGKGDGGADDAGTPIEASALEDGGGDGSLADASLSDAAADGSPEAGTADAESEAGVAGVPDATNLSGLAFNTYTTLLIAGDYAPAGSDRGLTLTMLTDDAVLAGGAASLRAINAVPSWPALDLGLSSPSGTWSPVLPDVSFAAASSQAAPGYGTVDANGYLAISPMAGDPMSARPSGSDAATNSASATSVEIDLGSIATVLAVGGKSGDTAAAPSLLLCMDNQPSGGLLSDCSIAQ